MKATNCFNQSISIAIVFIVLFSCKKDQYHLYNKEAFIQFGPEVGKIYFSSAIYLDSLKRFTFYYEANDIKQDTVFFDLYTIGRVSNTDRTVKIEQEQIPNEENAIPNVHYKAFDDNSLSSLYTIKAGSVHLRIPVILLRDPSLKTKTVQLQLKVVENNHFKLGEKSLIWRKITYTDRLIQPSNWDGWKGWIRINFIGQYSVTKHAFMIHSTQQKWDDDFFAYLERNYAVLTHWVSTLRVALIEYNNAHPGAPLTDEFGRLITFP